MPKITYKNKIALNQVPPGSDAVNYVRDLDMNEIKAVANAIDDNNPSQNAQEYEFIKTGNTGIDQNDNIKFIITADSKLKVQRREEDVWVDVTTIGASIETDLLYITEPNAQIRTIKLDGSQENLIRSTTTVEGVDVGNYNGTTYLSTIDDIIAVVRGELVELAIQELIDSQETNTTFEVSASTLNFASTTHFKLDAVLADVNAQFKVYKDSVSPANLIYSSIDDVFFQQGQGLLVPTGSDFLKLDRPFFHDESIDLILQINFVNPVTLRGTIINTEFVPFLEIRERVLENFIMATQDWTESKYFENASFDNNTNKITLTRPDATTVIVDLNDLVNDATEHIDIVSLNQVSNILTFKFIGGKPDINIDLSSIPNNASEIKAKLEGLIGASRLASSAVNTPALGGNDGLVINSGNASIYRNGFLNFPTSLIGDAAATIDTNAFTVPDWIHIKNSSSHVVTITQTGGTIDGSSNLILNENEAVIIQLVEANIWKVKADKDRFSDHSVTELDDVTNAGSGAIITTDERNTITNFDDSVYAVLEAGNGIDITHNQGGDVVVVSEKDKNYVYATLNSNFSILDTEQTIPYDVIESSLGVTLSAGEFQVTEAGYYEGSTTFLINETAKPVISFWIEIYTNSQWVLVPKTLVSFSFADDDSNTYQLSAGVQLASGDKLRVKCMKSSGTANFQSDSKVVNLGTVVQPASSISFRRIR